MNKNYLCDPFWYNTEENEGTLLDQYEDRVYLTDGIEKRRQNGIIPCINFIYDTCSPIYKGEINLNKNEYTNFVLWTAGKKTKWITFG